MLSLNPELAPLEMVFEQAMTIERLPPDQRASYEARLQESKVVLIRTLISDQLRYINIAKEWFTVADLAEIRRRKIGTGRIGGKAAGMLLALRILHEVADAEPAWPACRRPNRSSSARTCSTPSCRSTTWCTGTTRSTRPKSEMRADYPEIVARFRGGRVPAGYPRTACRELLDHVGQQAADRAFLQPAGR